MGCSETKDYPTLLCVFEPQNSSQLSYCTKLKDSLKPEKSIRFEIRSYIQSTYKIQLKINEQIYVVESTFDESQFENTKNKIYSLLGETPRTQ